MGVDFLTNKKYTSNTDPKNRFKMIKDQRKNLLLHKL